MKVTEAQSRKLDRLADALKDVEPERLNTVIRKASRIDLRVSESEKVGIMRTAKGLGLSASEYLLRLHQHARERLSK